MVAFLLAQSEQGADTGSFMMPVQGGTYAPHVDAVFYYIFWTSAVFFVLIAAMMFYFMWQYRRRTPGEEAKTRVTHNTPLELAWSILPAILLIPMFWFGFTGFMDMRTMPNDAYQIDVRGFQWAWEFTYPEGFTDSELHVPVNTPVRLVMRSDDVIHSLFIPAFRAKRDAVPGRYSELWFEATHTTPPEKPHRLFCTEYCGVSHSDMISTVHVHDQAGFADYLQSANPFAQMTEDEYAQYQADPAAFVKKYGPSGSEPDPRFKRLAVPIEMGKVLAQKKACATCHSIDGTAMTGPTWRGLFMSQRQFADGGSATADENYLRESIVNPGAHIVAGFGNNMPGNYSNLRPGEIDSLIAYIKSLKD